MGREESDKRNLDNGQRPKELIAPEVEELLTYRIVKSSLKYMVAIITLIGGILGYFGYSSVSEINKAENEIKQIKKDLISETDKLKELSRSQREEFSELQAKINSTLSDIKRYQDEIQGISQSLEKKDCYIENHLEESRMALDRMSDALTDLDTIQTSVNRKINGFDNRVTDFDQNQTRFESTIESISQKVFKSGSFVVKEKSETEIYGMDMVVKLSTIKGDRLRKFTVYENKYHQPLWGPKDVRIGQEIEVVGSQNRYKIIVRYVLEHWPGKDVAGLDILLSRD